MLSDAVADNLRAAMAKRGMRYADLAELTGFHPMQVGRYLNKETRLTLEAAHIFAHHVGADLPAIIQASLEDVPDLPVHAGKEEERDARASAILRDAMGRTKRSPRRRKQD